MTEMVNDHTPTETLPDNPVPTREVPALSVSFIKDGFTFTIRIPLHNLERDMGKLIARIRAAGGEPHMPTATSPTPKTTPKAEKKAAPKATPPVEPFYAEDGTRMCPRHKRPINAGKWGYDYCSAQESDPAFANTKGYCNLRFPPLPEEGESNDIPF